jgi:hypothetical protein
MAGDRSMEASRASRPLYYGSWGEAAQAHATVGVAERRQATREGFFAGAAIDAPATRTALEQAHRAGPAPRRRPRPAGDTRHGAAGSTTVQRRNRHRPTRRRTLPMGRRPRGIRHRHQLIPRMTTRSSDDHAPADGRIAHDHQTSAVSRHFCRCINKSPYNPETIISYSFLIFSRMSFSASYATWITPGVLSD